MCYFELGIKCWSILFLFCLIFGSFLLLVALMGFLGPGLGSKAVLRSTHVVNIFYFLCFLQFQLLILTNFGVIFYFLGL